MPKQSPLRVSRTHSLSDQKLLKKYPYELKQRFKQKRARLEKKGYFIAVFKFTELCYNQVLLA